MKKLLSEIKFDAEFIRGHTLQPQWYKIIKVFLILAFLGIYNWFFGPGKTLLFCGIFFGLSLVVHLLYRIKRIEVLVSEVMGNCCLHHSLCLSKCSYV